MDIKKILRDLRVIKIFCRAQGLDTHNKFVIRNSMKNVIDIDLESSSEEISSEKESENNSF